MKYWVYQDGEVPGAFEAAELARRPGFSAATLVCPADARPHERRWLRAGEFPDLIEAMRAHDRTPPPVPPAPAAAYADAAAAVHPDEILNAASHKIFRHVTELMKELENRREEQALTQSLQRTLIELKGELQAARERVRFLEDRVSTIPALEEKERRALEAAERLRADAAALEERTRGAEEALQQARLARENAELEKGEALRREKAARSALEALERALAEKEASLAKSLGLIRRLESELATLSGAAPLRQAAPPPPPPGSGPQPVFEDEGGGSPRWPEETSAPASPETAAPGWRSTLGEVASFLKKKSSSRPESGPSS